MDDTEALRKMTQDESATSQNKLTFMLFDPTGNPFQPVKVFNRSNGIKAYRIKPTGAGNKTAEATETKDMVDVARAMLVDGYASRTQAIAGGTRSYLTYGGKKLVRYQLDPDIAKKIGVPASGNVQQP